MINRKENSGPGQQVYEGGGSCSNSPTTSPCSCLWNILGLRLRNGAEKYAKQCLMLLWRGPVNHTCALARPLFLTPSSKTSLTLRNFSMRYPGNGGKLFLSLADKFKVFYFCNVIADKRAALDQTGISPEPKLMY